MYLAFHFREPLCSLLSYIHHLSQIKNKFTQLINGNFELDLIISFISRAVLANFQRVRINDE